MATPSRLSKTDQAALNDALHYMNMKELREECEFLGLKPKGKKTSLIQSLFGFALHGIAPTFKGIPAKCRAKPGTQYPIAMDGLILKGSYKCDSATRAFFKSVIGPHFHFTAFGIDWINAQWLNGKTPTYGEFAKMWSKESLRRKTQPARPKKEWAYLTFLQNAKKDYPRATRSQVLKLWKKEREAQVKLAHSLLRKCLNHP
jgi:hypothetical protein